MSMYKSLASFYDSLFPLKESRLVFIHSLLNKTPLAILDLGCATGELVLALAKKGHHLAGIDLDGEMIRLAAAKARKQGVSAEFREMDMLRIESCFPPGSFDRILSFGNTLVHLDSLETIKNIFGSIKRLLKTGGKVIVQVVNYDRILAEGIKVLPQLESRHAVFHREYRYHESKPHVDFITRLQDKKSGHVLESLATLYPLGFEELRQILVDENFHGLEFFGSENGEPYTNESNALVVLACK
jgi:glycine/sarcosine N-methyltransferase